MLEDAEETHHAGDDLKLGFAPGWIARARRIDRKRRHVAARHGRLAAEGLDHLRAQIDVANLVFDDAAKRADQI
ncbi:MAG: hypothetical protein IPL79_08930 [Myxococcales bacterium]|nr:hypothetical protein [Myxococcales bacterium]